MQSEQHQGGIWARIGVVSFLVALVSSAGFLGLSNTADLQAQPPASAPQADGSAEPEADAAGTAADAPEATTGVTSQPSVTLEDRVTQLESELEALRGPITENADNIQDLFVATDELTNVVKQDIELRLDAISEPDPSRDGYYVPRVYGNMDKSTYFADQMEKAVHATMVDRMCTLRVVNRTASQHLLRINDEGSWILLDAGQEFEKQLPAGAVVTRLQGQEPVSWFLGPPNYRQDVQIVIR